MNLRDMCQKYNIEFKKSLGQNLLLDDNINRIMVDAAALEKEDHVVEVGAGLGALTRRLCQETDHLLSVEIDRAFMPCLEEQFGEMDHVRLFRGDILNHELPKLINEFIPGGKTHKLVSNLPYYITTPILFQFLESELFFSRLVVMMQYEVGQRLVAKVGAENYGILALAAKCYADVDIVHRVPASCFLPKPKVDSCIVRFRCHDEPLLPGLEREFFMKVVRSAFQQRRKTLRNSLTKSGNFGAPRETVLEALEAAGIDGGRRPQTLTMEDFSQLALEIKARL
jgi:16S rRNA (adenine1518-N6/adenine1519-N6)-dimethyltransferase